MNQLGKVFQTPGTACAKAWGHERAWHVPGKMKAIGWGHQNESVRGRECRNEAEEDRAPSPRGPKPD